MADFCKACSIELFGKDYGDLADITKPEMWDNDLACIVMCEGCGPIQVDPQGRCIVSDCLKKDQEGHGEENVPP